MIKPNDDAVRAALALPKAREVGEEAEIDAWVESIGRITPEIRQRILNAVARYDKCKDGRPLVYTMHHDEPLTVGDLRSIAIALHPRAEAPAGVVELLEEIREMYAKLCDGTLHVPYCNGNHSLRVGHPDTICNCTLGREIKSLRKRAEEAESAISSTPSQAVQAEAGRTAPTNESQGHE